MVDSYIVETRETKPNDHPQEPRAHLDILVVDDDRLVLDVVSEIILASGHQARTAESGPAALDSLAQQPCDLVISDIRMPEMDGFELAGHIRSKYPAIHVVLMTGYSSDSTFREAMRLDIDAYLSKPFKAADLGKILDTIHATGNRKPSSP
ncbi:MAG: response regulator [candidate division Zixibacteria bacterium]|nr:response regulator [candidate division Zixibacteria bacterium]